MSARVGFFLLGLGAVCATSRRWLRQRSLKALADAANPAPIASRLHQPPRERPLEGRGTEASPRVAVDGAWATVLRDSWEEDAGICAARQAGATFASAPLGYTDGAQQFHGQLIWARGLPAAEAQDPATGVVVAPRLPVVLLVHTAVGPHDLFLHWHAQRLAARGKFLTQVSRPLFPDVSRRIFPLVSPPMCSPNSTSRLRRVHRRPPWRLPRRRLGGRLVGSAARKARAR